MMSEASSHALLCDLLGEDPFEDRPARQDLEEAARRCPLGGIRAARHHGEDVAVVRLVDGRLFVVPDTCPHDGGKISDGFVEEGRLVGVVSASDVVYQVARLSVAWKAE